MSAQHRERSLYLLTAQISTLPPSLSALTSTTSVFWSSFAPGLLLRAFYYTALVEDQEYSSIRPLIDWLDYNGYTVVTKADQGIRRPDRPAQGQGQYGHRARGQRHGDRAIVDQIVLFSGDGDFRSLVEAVQRQGVRVIVVSTVSTQPPMVADELRRQADQFIDIMDLQTKIGRDPTERPTREPREPRDVREPRIAGSRVILRNFCSAARPRNASKSRTSSKTNNRHAAPERNARPRLSALSAPGRFSQGLA